MLFRRLTRYLYLLLKPYRSILRKILFFVPKKAYADISFFLKRKFCYPNQKIIFIWIPKTAGTSIFDRFSYYGCMRGYTKKYLKRKYNNFITISHMSIFLLIKNRIISKKRYKESYKFTFVRNPWDRFVSLYFYTFGPKGIYPNEHTFEEVCQLLQEDKIPPIGLYYSISRGLSLFRPQSDWIVDSSGNLIVDFLGRFESLQDDFNLLCNKIGLPQQKLGKKNVSSHLHYKKYYTKKTREIIEKYYSRDIELFAYTF